MHQHITKKTAPAYLRCLVAILPRVTAALLANKFQNPDARYVVKAGCVTGPVDGTRRFADRLRDTIMLVVDMTGSVTAYTGTSAFANNQMSRGAKDVIVTPRIGHRFLSRADLFWNDQVNVWPDMAIA